MTKVVVRLIKAELAKESGEKFTVDFEKDIYQLYHDLQDNGVQIPPHRIPLEFGKVKLIADDEVSNHIVRLFREKDTLDDVQMMAQVMRDLREDIRPMVERWLKNNLYANKGEVYEHIRKLKIDLASEKVSFYCPLDGNLYNPYSDDYDEYAKADSDLLVGNQDSIAEVLAREQSPDCDMAIYIGDHAEMPGRVIFAEWNVEEICGELYGRIDCYLDNPLNEMELESLRNAVRGQNSDGLGEGFEQRPIQIDEGELYVSFWNSGDDYFLLTESEFEEHLRQQNGMGGIE